MVVVMQAVLCTKYGPPEVLVMAEVETPIPKAKEVLIKIEARTISMGDCEVRNFTFPHWIWIPIRLAFGIRRPRNKVIGQDFAGKVVKVGSEVNEFEVGDRVVGGTDWTMGAYAEFISRPEKSMIAKVPENVCMEDAVTLPLGGINALFFVRMGDFSEGDEVLVNGAGGAIGTFAVQLLRNIGVEVTAVDSEEKLEMLDSLGASEVMDYKKVDFTFLRKKYDGIMDMPGKISYRRSLSCLKEGGKLILTNPRASAFVRSRLSRKVKTGMASEDRKDLESLLRMLRNGKLKAVKDRSYALNEVVQGHEYVESGMKKGHVILS